MRGFKFNFITIFAFVLLVVYAYLAAMGLLYMKGSIPMAGMFFLGIVAVVSLCIYFMCRARATRWQAKVGIPAQIVLGLVIVATFFFIGKPFSSYVTMMGQRKQVAAEIALVVGAAKNLTPSTTHTPKSVSLHTIQTKRPMRARLFAWPRYNVSYCHRNWQANKRIAPNG